VNEIPKPSHDVLRRNAEHECGNAVGQITVLIRGIPGPQTISFYCNKPRLHTDLCEFIGTQVRVQATGHSVIQVGNAKQ